MLRFALFCFTLPRSFLPRSTAALQHCSRICCLGSGGDTSSSPISTSNTTYSLRHRRPTYLSIGTLLRSGPGLLYIEAQTRLVQYSAVLARRTKHVNTKRSHIIAHQAAHQAFGCSAPNSCVVKHLHCAVQPSPMHCNSSFRRNLGALNANGLSSFKANA